MAFCKPPIGRLAYPGFNPGFTAPSLLLPSTAKRFVDLHQCEEFVEVGLREAEFGGEVIRVVRQDFQVIRSASLVALAGKLRGVLRSTRQQLLLRAKFLVLLVCD